MTALSTLPLGIRNYLDDFVARSRRVALVRGAGFAAAAFLLVLLAWCGIDRLLHLDRTWRAVGLCAGALAGFSAVVRPLLNLRHRADWLSAAAQIERQNPKFAQRLITVTSRLMGSSEYRGSDEILLRLVHEVDQQAGADRGSRLVSARRALGPWAMFSLEVLLVVGLLRMPGARFSQLAIRFLDPLADVPPVTTTRLAVTPGNHDLVQSQPLTIEAEVERLGESPVTLFLSDTSQVYSRVSMSAAGGGRWVFNVAAVDRDLHYYVKAGDAQSPDYLIRVLRRPTVSRFVVEYQYPTYTLLPLRTVVNGDGRIEAPAGTRVTLTVTATEPLQAALLSMGGEKLLMSKTADPASRQVEFAVAKDARYSLDLISTREVAGSGPGESIVHALPDLPPQVRLVRGGDSLRLNPRDILPLSYEALDDFGVASLVVRAQVNAQPPVTVPLRTWGEPRRQQDVFNFDLATLPLGIGDLVTLTVVARDTAGQQGESEPLRVLISPRSVDLDGYARIAELQNAAQLAQSLSAQFDDAAKAEDEAQGQADHHSPAYLSAGSRGDRALTAASQTATLLRQSLLRAVTHNRAPQLSVALAYWVDSAEVESASADEAFRLSGSAAGMSAPDREKLHRAADAARQLQQQLAAAGQGEQAAATLADRENLATAEKGQPPEDEKARQRLHETVQRMRQDVAAEAHQLGLDPNAEDLDNQLKARIAAKDALIGGLRPVDFVAAAREWAEQTRRDPQQRLGLEARLSAAAQAEAVRPDSDLVRARDLQLASRAAGAITTAARSASKVTNAGPLDAFVADVETLSKNWGVNADPQGHSADEVTLARKSIATAEQNLSRTAGDPDVLAARPAAPVRPPASGPDRQKDVEDLALQASAAAARRDYAKAADLDEALNRRLDERPRRDAAGAPSSAPAETEPAQGRDRLEHHREVVRRQMASAQKIDAIDAQQKQLAAGPASGAGGDVAGRQQSVAEQIARVQRQASDPAGASDSWTDNRRDQATSTVLSAEETLASMPQALARVQALSNARRDLAARAMAARQSAAAAPPAQRAAAQRAADQAESSAREAADRLNQAAPAVAPEVAQKMAQSLEPFAPDTSAARAVLSTQLAPALAALSQALAGDDAGAVERAATEGRKAIEASQRELSSVQDSLVKRDPLVAAKWFARAAAQSLASQPPDLGRAKEHQALVSTALSRAWDESIHRAASERLSMTPALAGVLVPVSPVDPSATAAAANSNKFTAAREWGRLRRQDGPEVTNALHESDPPGYEEALKLYFEGLGKAQGGK